MTPPSSTWDFRHLPGPFDLIGDVHGCVDELLALLGALGWTTANAHGPAPMVRHPAGRTLVFVGDLVDRGPASPAVLRLVMAAVRDGIALCVTGNHDDKLRRCLAGRNVVRSHGLDGTMAQLAAEPASFASEVREFLDGLPPYCMLDQGRLVVAHAGLRERDHGRDDARVRAFALYGDTSGQTDEYGLPVRRDWAAHYRGGAAVVYGHTPVKDAVWCNNTINIDTGCVFGGSLTALRYPERQLVAVSAASEYAVSARPFRS